MPIIEVEALRQARHRGDGAEDHRGDDRGARRVIGRRPEHIQVVVQGVSPKNWGIRQGRASALANAESYEGVAG